MPLGPSHIPTPTHLSNLSSPVPLPTLGSTQSTAQVFPHAPGSQASAPCCVVCSVWKASYSRLASSYSAQVAHLLKLFLTSSTSQHKPSLARLCSWSRQPLLSVLRTIVTYLLHQTVISLRKEETVSYSFLSSAPGSVLVT